MNRESKSMLIVVFGLPGSGKSYFASKLAHQLKATYISSDITRNKLLTEKTYSHAEKLSIYKAMISKAIKTLKSNSTVTMDGTFYKKSIRDMARQTAKKCEAEILFMEVISSKDVIKERVERKREYSDADFSVYLKIKEEFEVMTEEHLTLESKRDNIEEMIFTALTYIESMTKTDE